MGEFVLVILPLDRYNKNHISSSLLLDAVLVAKTINGKDWITLKSRYDSYYTEENFIGLMQKIAVAVGVDLGDPVISSGVVYESESP